MQQMTALEKHTYEGAPFMDLNVLVEWDGTGQRYFYITTITEKQYDDLGWYGVKLVAQEWATRNKLIYKDYRADTLKMAIKLD
jgi:hypothetical protein